MSDVVPTLGRREERERRRGERGDVVEGARARGPHERFELRECHLDRIEIGAVGRQKADQRAGRLDGRAHLGLFVDGEVIEYPDVAASEGGSQYLLDVGPKAGGVDRPVEHGRGGEPGGPQRGDDGVRLPMTAGGVIAKPYASGTASVAAQEVGRDAAFIDKDIPPGVAQRQPVAPATPLSCDVGTPLFVGEYRFF